MSLIKLQVNNNDIIEEVNIGFLNADVASASSTLTLDSIAGFAIDQVLVLGKIGQEKSEIIKTHASSAPSGNTVTLASNTVFAHNRGETVYISKWDQYELTHATSSSGSKTALTTTLGSGLIAIDPERTETLYYDTEYSSGGYFVRKKNSITAVFSDYSDYIPYSGLAENTAGAVIQTALTTSGSKIDDEVLTEEFLLEALHEGRKELDNHKNIERWSFRTVFDHNLIACIPGEYEVAVPTTLRDPDTYKNVLSVRIGKNKFPLTQIDKRSMNDYYQGIALSTLNGAITTGSTSIILTASGDFDDSGTISVASANVSTDIDEVAYTGHTLSSHTLTTVTGIQAAGHASGTKVWQSASFGVPLEYTVFENKLQFSCPFSNDLAGENIYVDYYAKMTRADTNGDELDEPFYSIYVPYLRYRIKARKNNSLDREADSDYKDWLEKREAVVAKEFIAQDVRFVIDIPR